MMACSSFGAQNAFRCHLKSQDCVLAGALPALKPSGVRRKNQIRRSSNQQSGESSSLGVVVTGGTKGLGYCMIREFLRFGDRVVMCGRSDDRLIASTRSLQKLYPGSSLYSLRCDVSNPEDIKNLGVFAKEKLGTIDRWVNNAGEVTQNKLLSELETSEITQAVGTNVIGSMLGSAEAIRLMQSQPESKTPKYHILNLGFSSWGAAFSKSACTHKTTKIALKQLNESLSEEVVKAGITSIGIHNLSPGMVLTDLLLLDASPIAKGFFNALAEEPETVAAVIVPQIRSLTGTQQNIEFLTPLGSISRVLGGIPQILFGGRFFGKDGDRIESKSSKYKSNGVRILYEIDCDKY